MNISLPEDLIEIIEQLIIYEDMVKKEERDNFEYEYAYIEEALEDIDKSPTIIQISL
jgi:hypothetical protein